MQHIRSPIFILTAVLAALIPGTGSGAQNAHNTFDNAPFRAIVNPILLEEVTRAERAHDARSLQKSIGIEVSASPDVAASIRALGGNVEAVLPGSLIAATLPLGRVLDLAHLSSTAVIYRAQRLHATLDRSVPDIRANQVWGTQDPSGVPIRGDRVLVGIVDSGIDFRNADFKNPDGTSRIKYIWDQTLDGNAPTGYTFGFECDRGAIDSGTCPEKDVDGHGTHVAGIAAGNGMSSSPAREIGVAPRSDIIVVKSNLDSDKIIAAWKYLIDKARQLGEPIVINNSFGSQLGPHDGSEPISRAIDSLSGPGHIFVAAAGNEGNQGLHTDGNVASGATADVSVDAHGAFQSLIFGAFYSPADAMTATLTNSATGETFGPVAFNETLNTKSSADGKTAVTIDGTPWDGQHHSVIVEIDASTADPLAGRWTLSLQGTTVVDNGHFDAWMDSGQDHIQAFAKPNELDTIGFPGDARSVITVGNYATRTTWTGQDYQEHNVCDYTPCSGGVQRLGDIAVHSSVGPTSDGRQKPDIAAPGVLIISSLTGDAPLCTASTAAGCIDPMFVTPDGHNYIASGTSMSAPHVAGVVALMLQVNPLLSETKANAILRATARHDSYTGGAAWTPSFGAGKVDAFVAVAEARRPSRATPTPTLTPPPLPSSVPATVSPRVQVIAVRVDPLHGHLYSNLQGSALARVPVGKTVSLSIYAQLRSVAIGQRVSYTWTLKRGKQVAFTRMISDTVMSTKPGLQWRHIQFTARIAGDYTLDGWSSIGSTSAHGRSKFRVTAR